MASEDHYLFTVKETAKRLRMSVRMLFHLINDGEISFVNIGRGKKSIRRAFAQEDIDEFIGRRRHRNMVFNANSKKRPLIPTRAKVVSLAEKRRRRLTNRNKPDT